MPIPLEDATKDADELRSMFTGWTIDGFELFDQGDGPQPVAVIRSPDGDEIYYLWPVTHPDSEAALMMWEEEPRGG